MVVHVSKILSGNWKNSQLLKHGLDTSSAHWTVFFGHKMLHTSPINNKKSGDVIIYTKIITS